MVGKAVTGTLRFLHDALGTNVNRSPATAAPKVLLRCLRVKRSWKQPPPCTEGLLQNYVFATLPLFHLQQGCPRAPMNRSKVVVPRSLVGRVGAAAAMEQLRFPPPTTATTACSRDRWERTVPKKERMGRSARRDATRQTKKRVSAYLSMKVGVYRLH